MVERSRRQITLLLKTQTMRNMLSALALALLFSLVTFSATGNEETTVPEFTWQKEVDGFGATLVLSRQPDRFLTTWGAAPNAVAKLDLKSTEQAARSEPVVAFVLFSGCVPNARGLCDAVVDFSVLRPDGSEFAELAQADLWQGKEAPPAQTPQLGATSLGVVVNAEDPLGTYKILARACDAVAGRCLDLERDLEAVEPEIALDLHEFLQQYYRDPRPVLIEPALRALSARGLLAEANLRPPMIGFFALIFARNADFLPRWVPVIESLEPTTRESLKAAIALSQNLAALTSEEDLSPFRNDMLWGAFFATGEVSYVHAVVDRMKYLAEREDLNLFLTASSAQWSLCSNAKNHPVVAEILREIHASGESWRQDIDDALTKSPDEIHRAMNEVLRVQEEQGVW